MRGVYAVGRPELTQHGRWMAAVLGAGRGDAVLSHESAAALWEIRRAPQDRIELSSLCAGRSSRTGLVVHRRAALTEQDITSRLGIPTTTPACTLIDLAPRLNSRALEAAINEADKLDLVDFGSLAAAVEAAAPRAGTGALRKLLERSTFAMTDSELERRFLALVRRARLPEPTTGARLNGYKTDFWWPQFKLVVETDGLRYHRTPTQQARDRRRDQAHTAAGLTTLRFTHAQVRYERAHVEATLTAVIRRVET